MRSYSVRPSFAASLHQENQLNEFNWESGADSVSDPQSSTETGTAEQTGPTRPAMQPGSPSLSAGHCAGDGGFESGVEVGSFTVPLSL